MYVVMVTDMNVVRRVNISAIISRQQTARTLHCYVVACSFSTLADTQTVTLGYQHSPEYLPCLRQRRETRELATKLINCNRAALGCSGHLAVRALQRKRRGEL